MPHSYCNHILDLLSSWRKVRARKMFGGYGIYCDEVMFAILDDDALYFKVDETNRASYEAAGSSPFTYEAKEKRIALSYWLVPTEILDDADELKHWAEASYHVAQQNRAAKK